MIPTRYVARLLWCPPSRVDKDQAGTLHTSRTNFLTEHIDVSFNPKSLSDNQSFSFFG